MANIKKLFILQLTPSPSYFSYSLSLKFTSPSCSQAFSIYLHVPPPGMRQIAHPHRNKSRYTWFQASPRSGWEMRSYIARSDNSLPTFRDKLPVPFSRAKNPQDRQVVLKPW